MERQNTATRTNRYKNYRDDIKKNEQILPKQPEGKKTVQKHADTGEIQIVEKKEAYKPYKIYRSKKIRNAILYTIFVLIVIVAVVFGLLMFANYLGFKLW